MVTKKWTARDAAKCIVIPSDIDHKYSRGTLGAITGSAQYPGAAVLTCSAAVATGVGLLRFHSSSGLAHLVLHQNPEVVVQPGPVTAWIAGSGIAEDKYGNFSTFLRHRWFALLTQQSVPTLLDAGALQLAGKLLQPTTITPHAGELARLLRSRGLHVSSESIEADPKKWAVTASEKLGVVVLLKGSNTVVASGDSLIELPESTSFLATAGTGDVLAGIIGAMLTTNYIEILNSYDYLASVVASGAYIHAQAAVLASDGAPISASNIIEKIPDVMRKLLK